METPKIIGYARVSTDKQATDQQLAALQKAGCKEIFSDHGVSATAKNRPNLQAARAALREGDVFMVWAIDRAFRSTFEAIKFLDDLRAHGIAFRSLTQAIDTRTPEGRKWFIDTASWAEYEREIISRRTKERLTHLQQQGKRLGRPFKLSQCRIYYAFRQITEKEQPIGKVAETLNVAPCTLRRGFERYALKDNDMHLEEGKTT